MNDNVVFEFSKRMVRALLIMMFLSMILSYCLPVLFSADNSTCENIFSTVATLAGTTFLGYYGKSGVQNYTKIRKSQSEAEDNG